MSLSKDGRVSLEVLQEFHLAEQVIGNKNIEILKSYGLTPTQFYVLSVLAAEDGPLRIGQIIERISSTSGNMTVVIRNMEKSELVQRLEDPADRRSYLIALTDEGKELFLKIQPDYGVQIQGLFAALGDGELQVFRQLLKKIYNKEG